MYIHTSNIQRRYTYLAKIENNDVVCTWHNVEVRHTKFGIAEGEQNKSSPNGLVMDVVLNVHS